VTHDELLSHIVATFHIMDAARDGRTWVCICPACIVTRENDVLAASLLRKAHEACHPQVRPTP
jgi:hypothetical protein